MHKVYENDDLMMYFKKRYCHCCGKVLSRKRTEKIVYKNDPEHRKYCTIGKTYKPYGDILVIGKEYYCASCNQTFSCKEQSDVINAQKYYGRLIISKDEIYNIKNNNMITENNAILKMRWLLLVPVLGGLICTFKIFNGRLRKKANNKDLHKLILSAVLVFIGVALAIKLVFSITKIELLDKYQTLLMLIPSLLSFNIPILWYINHSLKIK